jgi:bifunctional UDP-N-acetylglucosamine pyrophosphorylase/glucosamine-1-phosphate N-acetyltransferase
LVLAAGEGKRMRSEAPKALCEILFKPMIGWVLDTVKDCGIKNTCVVVGHKNEVLKDYLKSQNYESEFAYQKERMGTAHAVMAADNFLQRYINGDVLILCGDSPFIDKNTVQEAYKLHSQKRNSATVITSVVENSFGYGRIVRNQCTQKVLAIVEEKDAFSDQKQIKEVNSGIYWFRVCDLMESLGDVSEQNAQREYYLTSIIKIFIEKNLKVSAYKSLSADIVLGANDCIQLQNLNEIARKNIIYDFLNKGINIPFPDGVIIGKDVKIEPGTTILPNTILSGKTYVGKNCVLGSFCEIIDCNIGNGCEIKFSFCNGSNISENSVIGPFDSTI